MDLVVNPRDSPADLIFFFQHCPRDRLQPREVLPLVSSPAGKTYEENAADFEAVLARPAHQTRTGSHGSRSRQPFRVISSPGVLGTVLSTAVMSS